MRLVGVIGLVILVLTTSSIGIGADGLRKRIVAPLLKSLSRRLEVIGRLAAKLVGEGSARLLGLQKVPLDET